ncbi:MAG: hypothetical protein Q8S57_09855 [Methanoregula sp.]|nr:hypothetical protein [Methanoregula sp.]
MSEIEKLLISDHGSTQIHIKRMGLLWEMNKTMNLFADEKNQKSSECVPSGHLYDADSQGELYES